MNEGQILNTKTRKTLYMIQRNCVDWRGGNNKAKIETNDNTKKETNHRNNKVITRSQNSKELEFSLI